jgi:hypothetical protein
MSGNGAGLRAVRGPITLITLGGLFVLNNFTPYGFGETWPVLLIVFGLLSLLGRSTAAGEPPPLAPPYGYQPPAHPADPSTQPQGDRR